MIYIALIAVIGVVLIQASGAVPQDAVGGSLMIAPVFIAAALAVGIHEAWTKRRGVLGWIVNIVVSFAAVFVAAPLAGMIMVMILSPFMAGSSIAATGGGVMYAALAGTMVLMVLASWGALQILSRWR